MMSEIDSMTSIPTEMHTVCLLFLVAMSTIGDKILDTALSKVQWSTYFSDIQSIWFAYMKVDGYMS